MNKSLLSTLILALAYPAISGAQVPAAPTRPGLVLDQPGQATNLQRAAPGGSMQSTELVQRGYQGQAQPGQYPTGPVAPPAPPEEFFYIDEGATGPDDLASGLSDYNSGMMSQAGAQLRGDYGSSVPYGSLPAGAIQDAWNRPFDNMSAGQSAPGTIRYQWTADLIMPVRLRAGMVSSVVLPEWEAAQDVLIGDGAAVEATILRPNQVAIKSVQTGLDTSMSIVGGSGNVYTFYLRTEGRNTRLVTDLQVFVQAAPSRGSEGWFNGEARNAYQPAAQMVSSGAGDQGAVVTPAGTQRGSIQLPGSASQGDEPVPVDRRVFNLKMYEVNDGDRIIAPEYAYTDGRFTYLHFSAGITDRPAVFRIVDGVEGRVNTRVTGRHSEVIVVEAIGDLVLRSGTRVVCIVTVNDEDVPSYHQN